MQRIEEIVGRMIVLLDYIEAYLTGVWAEVADEDFRQDPAIVRKLEDLGALCRHVPESVRALYPQVDWQAVEDLGETADLEIEEVEETTRFAREVTLKDELVAIRWEIQRSHTLN